MTLSIKNPKLLVRNPMPKSRACPPIPTTVEVPSAVAKLCFIVATSKSPMTAPGCTDAVWLSTFISIFFIPDNEMIKAPLFVP